MIEIVVNDRLGKKLRVKCLATDTVGDLKKVLAMQLGTAHGKLALHKGGVNLKDHISLDDYEVHDGTYLELYYL
ncbi:AaceriAER266Cp [[Ashbya] aceris (nom. inval.)]|nr:AaceriAER266Cp [[Ashbya] aceris (nom. inval.)]